jgi:hypothetical protein
VPIEPVRLDASVRDRNIPALLFVPKSEGPLPVVLLGHGSRVRSDTSASPWVFEAIPGPKRMGVWAGTHVEIRPEAIVQANQLLARTLG